MALSKKLATGFIEIGLDDRRLDSDFARVKQKTQRGFLDLASDAALLLTGLGVGAIIEGFNRQTRKMAADLETARVSFGLLIGSIKEGNKVFAELQKFSQTVPFSSDEVIAAARELHAARVPADKLTETLKVLGDIAAGSGKKLGEMVAIFSKIKNAGVLTSKMFIDLANKSIDLGPALKRALGVSNDELQELLVNGQITAEVVEAAFKNMTRGAGKFTGAMQTLSKTTQGRHAEMMEKLAEVMKVLGDSVEPIVKAFIELRIAALDTFLALPKPIQTLIGVLLQLTPAVLAAAVAFNTLKLIGLSTIKSITKALLFSGWGIPIIAAGLAIGLMVTALAKLYKFIRDRNGPALKRFGEAWDKLKFAVKVVADAILNLFSKVLVSLGVITHALRIDEWKNWLDFVVFALAEVANLIADVIVQMALWAATIIENWDIAWQLLVSGAKFAASAIEDTFMNMMHNMVAIWMAGMSQMAGALVELHAGILLLSNPVTLAKGVAHIKQAMDKFRATQFDMAGVALAEGFSKETNKLFAEMNAHLATLDAKKKELENRQKQDDDEKDARAKAGPRRTMADRSRSRERFGFIGLAEFSRELQDIANAEEQDDIASQQLAVQTRIKEIQQQQLDEIERLREVFENRPPVGVAGD